MVEEKQQTLFPKTEQWRLKSTHRDDVLVNMMQGLLIRFIGGDLGGAIVSICYRLCLSCIDDEYVKKDRLLRVPYWTLWDLNPRPHAIVQCEACALPLCQAPIARPVIIGSHDLCTRFQPLAPSLYPSLPSSSTQ